MRAAASWKRKDGEAEEGVGGWGRGPLGDEPPRRVSLPVWRVRGGIRRLVTRSQGRTSWCSHDGKLWGLESVFDKLEQRGIPES